jgi:glycosyltransferase involved in cell wall biosynthesis
LNNQSKTIVLVSSGQPSLNPRLVKEADSLAEAGYKVKVLYAYWNEWGTKMDAGLLPSKKWEGICTGGSPHQTPLLYLLSRVIHKFSLLAVKKAGIRYFSDFAIARSSYFLIRGAKRHKADLYIGHNLGALPAIAKAAKKYQTPCGFDAEDLHRYEASNDDHDQDVILKTYIENKYIPQTNYLSASSAQIADAYHQIFPEKQPIVLLNVFSAKAEIKPPQPNTSKSVKLFWFSQVIGPSRGIEDAVKALQILKGHNFELHLLGYHSAETINFIDELNGGVAEIYYHHPLTPDALFEFASQFDIGLALETGFSRNNDFALSNKIFTYMQAGLAVVASDTTAQSALLMQYPSIGEIYQKGDAQSLANVLSGYYKNRNKLFKSRDESFRLAKETLNWNNESKKFLSLVKKTLSNV